jgi:hypothetical protein
VAADTPTPEEKAAMDYVTRNGGKATLESSPAAGPRVSAKFEVLTDALLAGLKKFPQVGGIDTFDASACTPKGFAAFKEMPQLRKLVLNKVALTPKEVEALGELKELRHLGLVNANLTDAELESLRKLTHLEHLSLTGNPKITDKGMQTVKGFDRLQALHLGNTSITNSGLQELKVLDGLRSLNVTGTKVTADAAEKFPDDMPNLRTVRR